MIRNREWEGAQKMGITFVQGTVTGKRGKRETLGFLVDSGATYTLLPQKTWH